MKETYKENPFAVRLIESTLTRINKLRQDVETLSKAVKPIFIASVIPLGAGLISMITGTVVEINDIASNLWWTDLAIYGGGVTMGIGALGILATAGPQVASELIPERIERLVDRLARDLVAAPRKP